MTAQAGRSLNPGHGDTVGSPGRPTASKRLSAIAQIAIDKFVDNPAAFWSAVPELANAIELHLQASSSRQRKRVPVFEGYMTEREREFKLRSLSEIMERFRASGALPTDEAHKALAQAAALGPHIEHYKGTLLEIVERVLELPLSSPNPEKRTLVKGKPEHHTCELVRGLTLSLAWDGQLVAIALNPQEYQQRNKALSFVGLARDAKPDVARNHDDYLWATEDGR